MRILLILTLACINLFAKAQCVPLADTSGCGIHPSFGFCSQVLDEAVLGQPYDDTCTIYFPRASYFDPLLNATVIKQFDSLQLKAFNNLPQGLMVECQLDTCMVYPIQNNAIDATACIRIWGTPTGIPTSDAVEVEINAWLTMPFSGSLNVGLPPRTFRIPFAQNCSSFIMTAVDADDTTTPECDGEVDIDVFFGAPPYTYTYSTGDTGVASLDSLCPGIYSVTVTDVNGLYCTKEFAVPADTNVYSNIISNLPPWVDTLYNAAAVCDLDYSMPIDSFSISNATLVGSDTVLIDWQVYQLGQPYQVLVYYPNVSNGQNSYSLILYCENGRSQAGVFQLFEYHGSAIVGLPEDQKTLEFEIYPNPTTSIITVQTDIPLSQAWLTDLAGRRLMPLQPNSNQWQADLSQLPSGMYLIDVLTQEGRRGVRKVVRE